MPCRCDHMNPTARERESVAVMNLLNEVGLINRNPGVYGELDALDSHTQMLCNYCQGVDVTKHSLELQIWWRDHQAADKARIERELAEAQKKTDKANAIAKLTPYERKILGL